MEPANNRGNQPTTVIRVSGERNRLGHLKRYTYSFFHIYFQGYSLHYYFFLYKGIRIFGFRVALRDGNRVEEEVE